MSVFVYIRICNKMSSNNLPRRGFVYQVLLSMFPYNKTEHGTMCSVKKLFIAYQPLSQCQSSLVPEYLNFDNMVIS